MTPKKLTWLTEVLAGLLSPKPSHAENSTVPARSDKDVALPALGVFIDFDNINGAAVPLVLQHLTIRWTSTWRRAYGTGLAKHSSLLHACGILPIEVVPNTPRKNSADIALVIDVVLAACSDSLDAFCIVSSDGDYTRLALTLREMGKQLLVAGRSTTPPSLRSACTEFIDLDELSSASTRASVQSDGLETIVSSENGRPGFGGNSIEPRASFAPHIIGVERPSHGLPFTGQVDPGDIISLIRELTGDRGKTTLKAVHAKCSRRYADFSPRMCGATNWRTLLQKMTDFTVDPIKDKTGKIRDYAVGVRPAGLGTPTSGSNEYPLTSYSSSTASATA